MPKPRKADHPITTRRKRAGLSQYRLAKSAGMTQTHLRKIELGLIKSPGADTALRLADALGCDVRELFPQRAA